MEQKSLLQMLSSIIQELESNGQWGTAHVYRSAYNAFELFVRRRDIPFAKLTPALLKGFEIHLRERKCSWNTVSTYMKVVRATYNRSEEHTSELQSRFDLVCRLLLEKKKSIHQKT